MMLSGYTLGFFFPKQREHLAPPPAAQADKAPERVKIALSETRPDAESESREIPASFYFHRYF